METATAASTITEPDEEARKANVLADELIGREEEDDDEQRRADRDPLHLLTLVSV